MDYLGLAVGCAVAAYLLFAVGRYFYLNVKRGRFWTSLRNFLILSAVLAVVYYGVNHNWFGNDDPCYSYDARGICNE